MPALFFVRIGGGPVGPGPRAFAGVLYAGFFVAVAFGIAAALWLRRGMAPRFNTFVGLAVAEALSTGGSGAAVLVPVVNLTMVAVFSARAVPCAARSSRFSPTR
jgi:predicted outer membrane lipoprotein